MIYAPVSTKGALCFGLEVVELPAGSVLVMRGPTQHRWRHQLAKTSRAVGERINLTYRTIV